MLYMRVRLPELLEAKEVTPYRLAKDSDGRIGLNTVYRLIARRGHMRFLDTQMLDAICDVLKVTPAELLDRDDPPPPRVARKRRKQAQSQSRAA